MKKLTIFYQEHCPFCKWAFNFIDELKNENPEYSKIPIETIEETQQPEVADTFDYYYVPTFYIDKKKMHEGGIKKEELREILNLAVK